MKIEIVGWFSKSNVGDEAFKAFHSLAFRKHNLSFITPPNICNDPDMVILGGGAVVSPYYLQSMEHLKCPRYAIGVSIAYESEMNLMTQYEWKEIYVRDSIDVESLQKKVSCPVYYIPDLAFLYYPQNNDIISKYKKYPNKKSIGVLVTDYVNPAIDRPSSKFSERSVSFKENLAKELSLISSDNEIFLIPCSTGGYGDDRRINLDLTAFMKYPPTVIMDTLSPQDMIDLIAQMDLTICQKFHAHIFSIIAGTPFVSIPFTRKVRTLLDCYDLNHVVGANFIDSNFNVNNLVVKINEVIENRNVYKKSFLEIAHKNYHHLYELVQKMQSII